MSEKPGVEERVKLARAEIRAGEALPDWPPIEWVNALTCKLGEGAYHAAQFAECIRKIFPGSAVDHEEQFKFMMIGVAAVAMDAVEALERVDLEKQ